MIDSDGGATLKREAIIVPRLGEQMFADEEDSPHVMRQHVAQQDRSIVER